MSLLWCNDSEFIKALNELGLQNCTSGVSVGGFSLCGETEGVTPLVEVQI
ncbi:hypothetical protein [Desulfosporosinus acidiphilus]|nr:hypothetical protein [Desulfosporosinus acidiphilus]